MPSNLPDPKKYIARYLSFNDNIYDINDPMYNYTFLSDMYNPPGWKEPIFPNMDKIVPRVLSNTTSKDNKDTPKPIIVTKGPVYPTKQPTTDDVLKKCGEPTGADPDYTNTGSDTQKACCCAMMAAYAAAVWKTKLACIKANDTYNACMNACLKAPGGTQSLCNSACGSTKTSDRWKGHGWPPYPPPPNSPYYPPRPKEPPEAVCSKLLTVNPNFENCKLLYGTDCMGRDFPAVPLEDKTTISLSDGSTFTLSSVYSDPEFIKWIQSIKESTPTGIRQTKVDAVLQTDFKSKIKYPHTNHLVSLISLENIENIMDITLESQAWSVIFR